MALAGLTLTSNVAALACREGLAVQGSATEIPQATARAVTHSFVACFAFSGIVAVIFYYYF